MKVRKLDSNGDMVFGSGLNDFLADSAEGVAQIVKTTLLLWAGEWFLDITAGTPYPESILGKNSLASADATIQSVILNIDGVTGIENYSGSVEPFSRAYKMSCMLDTIYGPTVLEVQNYANF